MERSGVVARACADALADMPEGAAREAVAQVAERLRDPLRVAVAGRAKAGKSTLVNALIGRKVAPVGAGECTKVVTWYRFGTSESIVVEPVEGAARRLNFTAEGRLPTDLGQPEHEIARLVVTLSNETLRGVTLVDTPGLDSIDEAVSAATDSFLALGDEDVDAIASADALVYVVPFGLAADERIVTGFGQLGSVAGLSPSRVVVVLSRVDELADDPWPAAERVAATLRRDLRRSAGAVAPVMGLVAETTRAGLFTEADAHDIAVLASLDEETREDALFSADDFLDCDLELPSPRRERLLGLLDVHGLRVAVDTAAAGSGGAASIEDALEAECGFARLAGTIETAFLRRADVLKAVAAAADLDRISYRVGRDDPAAPALAKLKAGLQRSLADDALWELRLVGVLDAILDGRLRFAEGAADEVQALLSGRTGGVDGTEAARRWLQIANDARSSPAERRAAADVAVAYRLRDRVGSGTSAVLPASDGGS